MKNNKQKKTGLLVWFSWTLMGLSLLTAPVVSAETVKSEKVHCTTNSYGQQTCTTEVTEKNYDRSEHVKILPYHQTYDTALSTGQTTALISLLSIALIAAIIKLGKNWS